MTNRNKELFKPGDAAFVQDGKQSVDGIVIFQTDLIWDRNFFVMKDRHTEAMHFIYNEEVKVVMGSIPQARQPASPKPDKPSVFPFKSGDNVTIRVGTALRSGEIRDILLNDDGSPRMIYLTFKDNLAWRINMEDVLSIIGEGVIWTVGGPVDLGASLFEIDGVPFRVKRDDKGRYCGIGTGPQVITLSSKEPIAPELEEAIKAVAGLAGCSVGIFSPES